MDGREGLRSLMADFLLELLSEEIPARMQAKARNDLSRLFAESTAAAGLETGAIETLSTPRRLVLIARDIAEATQASSEEIKGPRSSAPPQALDGFLRKTGLAISDIGLWEINEAFAAQVLACLKALGSTKFAADHLGRSEAVGEIEALDLGALRLARAVGYQREPDTALA